MENRYTVASKGSAWASGKDDWHCGTGIVTFAEALEEYNKPMDSDEAYRILLSGDVEKVDFTSRDDVMLERANEAYVETPDDLSDWHNETRMQAAMAFGIRGWNDYS